MWVCQGDSAAALKVLQKLTASGSGRTRGTDHTVRRTGFGAGRRTIRTIWHRTPAVRPATIPSKSMQEGAGVKRNFQCRAPSCRRAGRR